MGFLDFLKKRPEEAAAPRISPLEEVVYSGMQVEVTDLEGRMLFVARLRDLEGDQATLHQFSETCLGQDQEPLRVRLRGYHERKKQAVCMEGVISPMPHRVWDARELTLKSVSNDRAFFRLDTNTEATAVVHTGPDAGEYPCRLVNISVGGACIRSYQPYRPGDRFTLKMRMLEDRPASVISCQVLRVITPDTSPNLYGCQFLDLSEADQDRITEMIFAAQRLQRNGRRL